MNQASIKLTRVVADVVVWVEVADLPDVEHVSVPAAPVLGVVEDVVEDVGWDVGEHRLHLKE